MCVRDQTGKWSTWINPIPPVGSRRNNTRITHILHAAVLRVPSISDGNEVYQHIHKLYRLFQTFKEKIPPRIDEIQAISANTNIYLVIQHAPLLPEFKRSIAEYDG